MAQSTEKTGLVPRAVANHVIAITLVFLAYVVAGKLGQATTNIRSSNLGPVWPAFGVALAAVLLCGYRVWLGIAGAAFVVAFSSSVPHLAALGQAAGATIAALTGAFLLRRIAKFNPSLSSLHDAISLIVFGGLLSAMVSASIGIAVLYATHVQAYSGIVPAWLIYWFGDSTGVLLVTPIVLTFPSLLHIPARSRIGELAALLLLLTATCFIVFGDFPLLPVKLHVLAFAVLPFVMWAAIRFGVAGAAWATLFIATIATISTGLGSGPFAQNTAFTDAVLLDVFFAVLSVSGMTLAAVIAERELGEREREALVREQATMEARLRITAAIESSDERFRLAARAGKMYAYEWDAATGIAVRSEEYANVLGLGSSEKELTREQLVARVHSDDRAMFGPVPDQLTPENPTYKTSYRMLRDDGSVIWLEKNARAFFDEQGKLLRVVGMVADISERKRAEEALASVSGRLIEAQEQERSRIARELHDDIGQRLALLTVELEQLREHSPGSPAELHGRLHGLHQQADQIAADVQSLSHELHSSRLEYLGLVPAMRGFCKEFSQQQKVEIAFSADGLPAPVPLDISLCLFRVMQEALHNSAKYSGVRYFEVAIRATSDEIHLTVQDSGAGFDSEEAKQGRGLGLVSMQERLKLLKGNLVIESQPKRGTTILARVPFSPESGSMRAAG